MWSVTTGTAVSIRGGDYKGGHTVTRTASFSWDSPAYKGKRGYYVEQDIRKIKEDCYVYSGGSTGTYAGTNYYWRSVGMTGGTKNVASEYAPTWATCVDIAAGWWARSRNDGESYTTSTGFNLSDFVGFDVSTEQNWDTYGKLMYWTPTNNGYQLCGSGGDYPAVAGRIRGKRG